MDAYRRLWKVGTIRQYKMILHFCSILLVLISNLAMSFWNKDKLKDRKRWLNCQVYMIYILYALSPIPLMAIMNSIMDQSKEMCFAPTKSEQDDNMYYNLT